MSMWMTHGYRYVDTPGINVFHPLLLLIFGILIVWLLVSLFRTGRDNTPTDHDLIEEETALEVLKKRYVRGEISKRQYLDMKKDITD